MTMSSLIPDAQNVTTVRYKDLTTNNPVIGSLHEDRRIFLAHCNYKGDGKPKKHPAYIPTVEVPGFEITGILDGAKFVVRLPDHWNGKLVVFAVPGFGDERSGDSLISDYVLCKVDQEGNSYAYVAVDKGTVGEIIPTPDGKLDPLMQSFTVFLHNNDNIIKWGQSVKAVTLAVNTMLVKMRGQAPIRTYLIGMSNGGYTARFAMENFDELYDGMLDWEGVLWQANAHNPISQFSSALNAWRTMATFQPDSSEYTAAAKVFCDFGLPPEGHALIPFYGPIFFTQHLNIYRMKFDPEFLHREWWEYAANPEDYEGYNYFDRSQIVRDRIAPFENTGRIRKPTITVFGNYDALIFYKMNGIAYEQLVKQNGDASQYRLYTIDRGTHLDCLVEHPVWDKQARLQPLMPYIHQAFDILVEWVERGQEAPPSRLVSAPQDSGKVMNILTGQEILPY